MEGHTWRMLSEARTGAYKGNRTESMTTRPSQWTWFGAKLVGDPRASVGIYKQVSPSHWAEGEGAQYTQRTLGPQGHQRMALHMVETLT